MFCGTLQCLHKEGKAANTCSLSKRRLGWHEQWECDKGKQAAQQPQEHASPSWCCSCLAHGSQSRAARQPQPGSCPWPRRAHWPWSEPGS